MQDQLDQVPNIVNSTYLLNDTLYSILPSIGGINIGTILIFVISFWLARSLFFRYSLPSIPRWNRDKNSITLFKKFMIMIGLAEVKEK